MLTDKFGRSINYLRLSVTDKCNLRCFYCMPEEGIDFWKKKDILSYEELLFICSALTANGIEKIRITGGEPFVRKDLPYFLKQLSALAEKPELSITSNAVLIGEYTDCLKESGIRSLNLSLDACTEDKFFSITRRNDFRQVWDNLHLLIREGFDVKLNCVVMEGRNIDDLVPLAELAREQNISVRFLEEMPFNARTSGPEALHWDYIRILDHLKENLGQLEKIRDCEHSTSLNYRIKGFKGTIGVIPSYSRTFCGSCNRIRISANGDLRTCLYGSAALNVRDEIRSGISERSLLNKIQNAVFHKPVDGFAAEKDNKQEVNDSMAHIGG